MLELQAGKKRMSAWKLASRITKQKRPVKEMPTASKASAKMARAVCGMRSLGSKSKVHWSIKKLHKPLVYSRPLNMKGRA